MKTEVYIVILLCLIIPCGLLHLPVKVTYTQQFGDQEITLTERMTVAQRLDLRNKEGFLCYGSP
mgnify:CR=1 FL=1